MYLYVFLLYVDQNLGSKTKTQQTTKVNVKVQFINRLLNVVCESWWANADSATSCNESLRLLRFPFIFRCMFRWTSAGFGKGELCPVELLSVMMGCWCPWLGSWRMHYRLRLYRFPLCFDQVRTWADLCHTRAFVWVLVRTRPPIWNSCNGLALLS